MTRCHIRRQPAPDSELATTAGDQLALGAKPVLLVISTLSLIDLEGAGRDLFLCRLVSAACLGSRSCRGYIFGRGNLGSIFAGHFAVLCGPKVGQEGQAVKKIRTARTLPTAAHASSRYRYALRSLRHDTREYRNSRPLPPPQSSARESRPLTFACREWRVVAVDHFLALAQLRSTPLEKQETSR